MAEVTRESQPIIDKRKIVVKNIPVGSSNELITNYLEVVCKSEVTQLHFHPDIICTVCLATLEDELTDDEYAAIVKKTGEKLLTGQRVAVERVAVSSQILLHDVDPSVTKEYLELYIENILKGTSYDVNSITTHPALNKAVILLNDPEAVGHLLEQDLTIRDMKLKAEPFFEEYHQYILNNLEKQGKELHEVAVDDIKVHVDLPPPEQPEATSRSRQDESGDDGEKKSVKRLTQLFEKDSTSPPRERDVNPSRNWEMGKTAYGQDLTNDSQPDLKQNLKSRTSPVLNRVEGSDLPDFIRKTGEVDLMVLESQKTTDVKTEQHLPKQDTAERAPVRKPPIVAVKPLKKWMEQPEEIYYDAPEETSVQRDSFLAKRSCLGDVSPAGQMGIPTLSPRLTSSSDGDHGDAVHKNLPREENISSKKQMENEPVKTEEKHFAKSKLALLKLSGFLETELGCQGCQVTLNEETGLATFCGTETQNVSGKLAVHESTINMLEVPVKFPHSSVVRLFSSPNGQRKLQSQLAEKNHKVVISRSAEKDHLWMTVLNEKDSKLVAAELQKIVISEVVNLIDSHLAFVQSDEWRALVQKIQDGGWVALVTDKNKKRVYLNGLSKDVADAKKEILSILKDNATVTKAIKIDNPKGKFIHQHCKYQLMQINEKLRDKKVNVKIKQVGREYAEVDVGGLKDVVKLGEDEIRSLEKGLAQFNVDIPGSVLKTKLWPTFSSSSKIHSWIEELEKSHKCCIVPHISKTRFSMFRSKATASGGRSRRSRRAYDGAGKSSPDRGNFQRTQSLSSIPSAMRHSAVMASASSDSQTFGQIILRLKSGDITLEKSDALVNVIHHSLDLQKGHVCRIFAKKGGPQLQQALTAKGKGQRVTVGDVYDTPGSGSLQCKTVLHVVLDTFQTGAMQVLQKGVRTCLTMSANHSSLAFPTLGCGNLKFPSDQAARIIIEEIKQFGQTKVSNLKNVTIVVFDAKLLPVFSKALQASAPAPASPPSPPIFASPYHRRWGRMRKSATFDQDLQVVREARHQTGMNPAQEEITVQNTTIIVKKGNIVTERAKVLVNITNKDLDLSRGRVSESFLKAGGDELQDNVSLNGKAKDGEVVVVPSCGSLATNCDHIANVVLPRYSQQKGMQVLAQVVMGTLIKANKLGADSVAFPSLGCGKLSYPYALAARTVLQEVKKYSQSATSIKVIKIVIFESKVYDVFAQCLRDIDSKTVKFVGGPDDIWSEHQDDGSDNDDLDDNEEDDIEDEDEEDQEEKEDQSDDNGAASYKVTERPRRSKDQRHDSKESHFTVVTFSDSVKETKEKLLTSFEDRFHQLSLDIRTYISDKAKAEMVAKSSKYHLEGVAKKHDVEVGFDLKALTVDIEGKQKDVWKAFKRMGEIIVEENKKMQKPEFIKKNSSFADYCEFQVRRECDLPTYWDDSVMKDFLMNMKAMVTSKSQHLRSPSKLVEKAVEDLFTSTWQQQYVGHGQDSAGITPGAKPQITKVQVIQNPELFRKYFVKRQQLFYKVMKKEILPLEKVPSKNHQGRIMTYGNVTELTKTLQTEVNEAFLFHGPKAEVVDVIASQGVDFRLANETGMLGRALYTAESSTKADQYTDKKHQRTNKDLKMVLMRVALGKIYVCEDQNPKKFPRPPCVNCHKETCLHTDGLFDSVVYSNPSKNFREFAVYANDQCYPEFLITYNRI